MDIISVSVGFGVAAGMLISFGFGIKVGVFAERRYTSRVSELYEMVSDRFFGLEMQLKRLKPATKKSK